jgi:PHD/YefM family antitoxin component YafN of YafNO toxin-antitoxin module
MATRAKAKATTKPRQYLVDDKGQRTGVILSFEEYEELIEAAEQLDDIRHLEQAKKAKGKPLPLEEFEARLRARGKST